MKLISLLPADVYTVVNKTILTEKDKNVLISLYEPIIGPMAISLYLTLWRDLEHLELISKDYTHHHLMTILKSDLESIKEAREGLEAVGILKTYLRKGEINSYIYELYSPLTPKEFFMHPIFNVVLYNNIGKKEYEELKECYQMPKIDMKEYEDISKQLNETFTSYNGNLAIIESDLIKDNNINKGYIKNFIDFDLIVSSIPKGIINEKTFNDKTKNLINELAFIYNFDSLKMAEMIRISLNENGLIDKENLRKTVRKYYQYDNAGSLPTLIYRNQPEYLRNPNGDDSNRGKLISVFENTTPYDFLRSKYKGAKPTTRDLKLLENLLVDYELKPAVVNVLIDYILKSNDNKLIQGFVETIAGQWKRLNIETASDAMTIAEKEHQKYSKKNTVKKENIKTPIWFDKNIEKEEISEEEKAELEDLLKEFR